ncbi:MAG: hypothetical protein ACFB0C_03810 [Leptolyngbyaceae cyanobacterium]
MHLPLQFSLGERVIRTDLPKGANAIGELLVHPEMSVMAGASDPPTRSVSIANAADFAALAIDTLRRAD